MSKSKIRCKTLLFFLQVLKTAMSRCLLKIQEYPFPSISFPVIGSGVLHLPKDEVADIMIDEVLSFAKEHPGRKLDVYFVIHPNNSFVYKVRYLVLTISRRTHNNHEESFLEFLQAKVLYIPNYM